MYHCHLNIYLAGQACNVFDVIREMPPFPRFTHTFVQEGGLSEKSVREADVIFANLQGADAKESLRKLSEGKAQLILLTEKKLIPLLTEELSQIMDIWILPMSDEEARFRFLRWQQACKREKDFWQEEQYVNATMNGVPNMIWYKDKEGIHRKVNDSFCRTANKPRDQIEGKDHYYIWDVDPGDPANEGHDCQDSDNEVIRRRQTCVFEENVKTGDSMRLFTTYKSPLYDLDGSVMGTVGVGIDVTQERAYQQELLEKNHILEMIFSTIDCGVICHTVQSDRILSVNEAALKILGYSSREELVKDGFDVIAPSVMDEDKPKLRDSIKMLKKEGDSASIEYRVQHKNGDILHVMGNIKLIRENGELFYQRFLLDCTAQKLQEKKNERHQAGLIQALSVDYNFVCFVDLDTGIGIPLQVGEETGKRHQIVRNREIAMRDSLEKYIETEVYEDDREMMRQTCSLDRIMKELAEKQLHYVNYRIFRDGEIKYYEMKIVRAGTWGENHGIVLGMRSVDEETRKEMEQKRLLEDALAQANKANKAKSIFLSNMSHDIRTPMNAIVGFTTLALTHIDSRSQVEEYLQKIRSSGSHMLNLINDILDMSRIESGRIQIEEAPCNLSEILHGLSNMVQTDIQAKTLTLNMDMKDVVNEDIRCDRLRLNQVLLNVLGNAVKYTNAGGTISFSVREKGETSAEYSNYEFCVEDTGIGMGKEFLSHIFEPFEREKNTTVSGIQGTGLGMAITKNLVDMMKGTIEVESEPGRGTKVTLFFTFPLNPEAEERRGGSGHSGDSASEGSPRQGILGRTDRGVILLAEDNELNQEIAKAILEDVGFQVEVAENGRTAVEMLKKAGPGHYQLVLMDVQMPVMNGYEATREIRALEDKRLASIPILAMTANAFEEDKRDALSCGMNGHIAKPLDVGKLFEMLGNILE